MRFVPCILLPTLVACTGPQGDTSGPDLTAGATVEERVFFYDDLGQPGATENVERLSRAIGRDHDRVQLTVIEALGRIGTAETVPVLERASHDDLTAMRVAVAQAAAKIEPPAPIELLHRLATEDESLKVRQTAVFSLARVARPESVPVFVSVLESEEDEDAQRAALAGLAHTGAAAAPALPLLIDISVSAREQLRWDAVEAIRHVGTDEAARALGQHVASEIPQVRGRACLALAELEAPGAIDQILDALAVERQDVAAAAMARAAALLGEHETSFEVLERILLRGDPWQSRLEAALAFGESGTLDHIRLLQEAQRDPKGLVRANAGEAIERIRSRFATS